MLNNEGQILKEKIILALGTHENKFSKGSGKENFRSLYQNRKDQHLVKLKSRLDQERFNHAIEYFAFGKEIDVKKIKPTIKIVENKRESDLFELATSFWSVPPSPGYGRRMRFLIIDQFNGKLIGIIALGDPVIGLKPRDEWIGWSKEERFKRISSILDAYALGAVPPYNKLLAGKLLVSLLASKEISDLFDEKYKGKESVYSTEIKSNTNNKKSAGLKPDGLALITVSSALGKSSIYNRVKIPEVLSLERTGTQDRDSFSSGWGHFHISDELYSEIIQYLKNIDHNIVSKNRYGHGANYKMRAIKQGLSELDISKSNEKLIHGIKRECFAMPLSTNFREYLQCKDKKLKKKKLISCEKISEKAKERWIIPRAERITLMDDLEDYKNWDEKDISNSFKWFGYKNLSLFR